jgi:hypothetical protein
MNIVILNWPGPPWEGDQGGVKRTGRDEPVGVVIHVYMETTQGISLCSYLYLKLAKMPCFSFMFYAFSTTNLANKRVEQVLDGEWGLASVGRVRRQGKG